MFRIDSMRNEKIHFAYTSPEDLDFVLDMENKSENKEFVIPYEKSKHEGVMVAQF